MSLSNGGKGLSESARRLGRHKSTISGERKRNAFSPSRIRLPRRKALAMLAERPAMPGESLTTRGL
ncbi:helix-turn-helix domain-containing protein [Pyramidobacter sp. CG50-2]|uniref:helix-turn-helix domain-containing protein n=2 Tax=unclassified Pyramidobacter TaxID=2632171 RepID=UPI000EA16D8D|nr:hypothetical protein D7D26_06385 [Pyramidobacter sp. CG50-2]